MSYSEFIQHSLFAASAIANEYFGKVSGTTKAGDNNQVLTEADIAIGRLLVEKVQAQYPDHNIIDEEAGVIDKHSAYTWVIDPIDGTSNFASGVPLYGVMISLLHDATPVAGGIALPFFNDICLAEKGKGAFSNGEVIHVSTEQDLKNSLVAYGIDGHQEALEVTRDEATILGEIVLNIRNLRTSNSAYDSVQVANGAFGACLNRTTKIWDNVAPHIIIEEAGGIFTDFYGKPIDYSSPLNKANKNFTICAGSPVLHAQLQNIITLKNIQ